MSGPTFDAHGYPNDETLARIKAWPSSDPNGVLDYIKAAWPVNK